ncbi:MAG: HAMP domain-containing protein, partial [Chloroflexota bacterium]
MSLPGDRARDATRDDPASGGRDRLHRPSQSDPDRSHRPGRHPRAVPGPPDCPARPAAARPPRPGRPGPVGGAARTRLDRGARRRPSPARGAGGGRRGTCPRSARAGRTRTRGEEARRQAAQRRLPLTGPAAGRTRTSPVRVADPGNGLRRRARLVAVLPGFEGRVYGRAIAPRIHRGQEEALASRPEGAPPSGRRQEAAHVRNDRLGRFGLRLRLGVLAIAVAVPLLAANVVWLLIDVNDARVAATQETRRLAEAFASALDQTLEGTRTALVTIAAEEELQNLDAERCREELSFLLPQFPEYSNLSAADREGDIFCSAAPAAGTVNLADRAYFQRAIEGEDFVVGEYQIGRIVGRPLVIAAVPIRTPEGEIIGTVHAAITVDRLAEVVGHAGLPTGAALTVLDRSGTVLVRLPGGPEFVGQRPPESELVDAVVAEHEAGADGHGEAIARAGIDGVERLYAIHGVSTGDDALHVAVGFSTDQAYAGAARRFAAGMAVLLAALLVALALLVTVGRRLVVGPVESLARAANQIAEGDLGARTGLGGGDELGRLADAFDRMADSVQARVVDRTAELTAALDERDAAQRQVREYLDVAIDPLVVTRPISSRIGR